MKTETIEIYITDNTGKRFFNTLCSRVYGMSEVRNLEIKLKQANEYPEMYKFLDVKTAKVIFPDTCGDYFDCNNKISDDELYKELEDILYAN